MLKPATVLPDELALLQSLTATSLRVPTHKLALVFVGSITVKKYQFGSSEVLARVVSLHHLAVNLLQQPSCGID